MNSLVSYNWLKEYVDLKDVTPDDLAKQMSLCGPAVEKIIPRDVDFEKIVVGQITSIKPHPNADKLRLVTVDIGTRTIDLVCGGINLKEKQWVPVAQIGARVRWHGQGDLITMEAAEIRGVKSEGMICAADEIGLAEAFPHAEREILDLGIALPKMKLHAGTPLADVLELAGDVIMDIEVTSNRVDAFGMVGLAREASVILNKKLLWKEPSLEKILVTKSRGHEGTKSDPAHSPLTTHHSPSVTVHDNTLCPRYLAVRMTGVKNKPSPWWMKQRLLSAGIRPISALVDITNYVLLECAQPMHVFDETKMTKGSHGTEIHIRLAREGEKIKALDGKTYDLDDQSLVIADAERPVAVAGVMGGEDTGVDEATTDIVFEAATFDAVSVRRTARRLNLYSDSQLRFEKGLSTESVVPAMARAIELTRKLCGGTVVGPEADVRASEYKPLSFSIGIDEMNKLIGIPVKTTEIVSILKRLGFGVKKDAKKITAEVPWWRDKDIESGRDLVEEVARMVGYGALPPTLPFGLATRASDAIIAWEDKVRDLASASGYTELYGYSFVSKGMLEKAGFDASRALRIENPLTADLEYMRPSLLPSILDAIAKNSEREDGMHVFECANVYLHKDGTQGKEWKDLPNEFSECVVAIRSQETEEPWREAKGFVELLVDKLGVSDVRWARITSDSLWHPGRSIQAFVGDHLIATIGEIAPDVVETFGIKGRVGAAAIYLQQLVTMASPSKTYIPPSAFPASKRDLAIIVDRNTAYGNVMHAIRGIDALVQDIAWFDTYEGKGVPDGKKSLAIHLTFSSPEKTLTTEEVDAIMEKITLALKEKFEAEIR